ncbi:MAG: S41 family peptidase, partial [Bacteroidota bacterium]|nr:S41 family peptidase [Bacteroidota bacterium]
PYAELIEERENSEVDALSRGRYGGLGIKVRNQRGRQIVSYIYDEVIPLTNLRIGDEILRVDGVSLADEKVTDLRPLLRGEPGSSVQLVVRRPGVSDSLDLIVQRRSVTLDPLLCVTLFDDGILYVKISRFTRSSADSVRNVLRREFAHGGIRGVIIDVRDNPGGLLEAAVALVDQFINPGGIIVSMRGRQPGYARNYPAREEPVDVDVPLAVLVNGRSASASEIVAGALQDLDRAVVIGQRTFGKGLVQTLVPLSHGAVLKLTTSRYYIPSGRCIQRLVYRNGKARDAAVPASNERTFRSLRLGRPLHESIGIIPDVTLPEDSLPPVLRSLEREYAAFHFVSRYNNRFRPHAVPDIDAGMQAQFRHFADSLLLAGEDPLLRAGDALAEQARNYDVEAETLRHLEAFRDEVRALRLRRFDMRWTRIRRQLTLEFVTQLSGESARILQELDTDAAVLEARMLLADAQAYEAALLSPRSH